MNTSNSSDDQHRNDSQQVRAVVFTGQDQVEVQSIARPTPEPEEVLVRNHTTLISTGTETTCLARRFAPGTHWDEWVQYPFYTGYCGAGEIVELAEQTGDWQIGDHVVGWLSHQTYAATEREKLVAIPESVTFEEAAWVPMGCIASYGFRKANVQIGETVVVLGLGILGQLIVQLSALAGAERIIAIDPAGKRVDMAAAHGATHPVKAGAQDATQQIADLTGGEMADVAFEMTGHPQVFAAAQGLLGDFGRLVLVGDTGFPEKQHLTPHLIRNNLTLIGAHQRLAAKERVWTHARLGEHFINAIASKQIRVADLITNRFALEDAADAFELLQTQRDQAMGVVLEHI